MSEQRDPNWAHLPPRPWRYQGCTIEIGPKVISSKGGVTTTVGAPGQPMGACDHCGTGIAECHRFESKRTGETFMVGSTCVYKLLKAMRTKSLTAAEREIKRRRNAAARDRRARKLTETRERATELLAAHHAALAGIAHPIDWRAKQGATLADWAEWMLANGGLPAAKQVITRIEDELNAA